MSKRGRWVYYRRADTDAPVAVRNTYSYLQHCVGLRAEVKRDQARLVKITSIDPEELCRIQAARKAA